MSLLKERGGEATVLKMDLFDRGLDEHNQKLSDVFILAKVCASETIQEFARKLVSFHHPASFDYAAKFGITEAQQYSPRTASETKAKTMSATICDFCHSPVEEKVINYCRAHEQRFAGKVLCRKCQVVGGGKSDAPAPLNRASKPTCKGCSADVDSKVVAFCRINSRRFNKRVLCRASQVGVVAPVA